MTTPINWDQYKRFGSFSPAYPSTVRRYFSPDDDVHGILMAVLSSCHLSLAGSMYGYDDDEVNALLLTIAANPAIPFQLCLDKTQAGGKHEKALIEQWPHDVIGNRIVVGSSRKHAINHLKLFCVDGRFTIGGSTNLSGSGEEKQNNELIIIDDSTYAAETRAKCDLCFGEMLAQMSKVAV